MQSSCDLEGEANGYFSQWQSLHQRIEEAKNQAYKK